jgi:hypothetical protein
VVGTCQVYLWVDEVRVPLQLPRGLCGHSNQLSVAFDFIDLGEDDLDRLPEVLQVLQHLQIIRLQTNVSIHTQKDEIETHRMPQVLKHLLSPLFLEGERSEDVAIAGGINQHPHLLAGLTVFAEVEIQCLRLSLSL